MRKYSCSSQKWWATRTFCVLRLHGSFTSFVTSVLKIDPKNKRVEDVYEGLTAWIRLPRSPFVNMLHSSKLEWEDIIRLKGAAVCAHCEWGGQEGLKFNWTQLMWSINVRFVLMFLMVSDVWLLKIEGTHKKDWTKGSKIPQCSSPETSISIFLRLDRQLKVKKNYQQHTLEQ